MLYIFWRYLYDQWAVIVVSEIWSCKDVKRAQDLSGDCRADRCIHRYDQPCEPIIELWQWWIWHGIPENGSRRTKRHKRIDNVRSACCVRAQQADLFKGEDKYSTSLWYIYSIPVRWKDIHDPDGKNSQITKKTCYVVLNTI